MDGLFEFNRLLENRVEMHYKHILIYQLILTAYGTGTNQHWVYLITVRIEIQHQQQSPHFQFFPKYTSIDWFI